MVRTYPTRDRLKKLQETLPLLSRILWCHFSLLQWYLLLYKLVIIIYSECDLNTFNIFTATLYRSIFLWKILVKLFFVGLLLRWSWTPIVGTACGHRPSTEGCPWCRHTIWWRTVLREWWSLPAITHPRFAWKLILFALNTVFWNCH